MNLINSELDTNLATVDLHTANPFNTGNRYCIALREAEIEEHNYPEVVSAEDSDARMKEIFRLWDIEYCDNIKLYI